jgi:uncharacterized protein YndB with AHSA1/START domain
MRPVSASTTISAPREKVFDYVADLSGRVAFSDHYMKDLRLARANSEGLGAAARFRIDPPFGREWAEISVVECDHPRRIREEGRVGREGRTRLFIIYDFLPEGHGSTRVELTAWSEPATRFDAFKESFGAHGWLERQLRTALARLRMIFENPPSEPLARTSVAGYEPLKSPRFGA